MRRFIATAAFLFGWLTASAVAQNTFTCPSNDGQTVTDSNGVQYMIGCARDTTNDDFNRGFVTGSFNDCFQNCSTNALGPCTAFTYVGATQAGGTGSGSCYYKNGNAESFSSGSGNMVGAIRVANYVAPNTGFKGPTFKCPANNYTAVTDPSGVQYILGCAYDTTYNSYTPQGYPTDVGFDDCFYNCSNNIYPTTDGPGHCVAFEYSGGLSGVGGGNCYYKAANSVRFQGVGDQPYLVGAIMLSNYDGPPPTSTLGGSSPATTSTSSSTRSTATAVSSPPATSTAASSPSSTAMAASSPSSTATAASSPPSAATRSSSASAMTGGAGSASSSSDGGCTGIAYTTLPPQPATTTITIS